MAWSKRTFRRGEMASYTFFTKNTLLRTPVVALNWIFDTTFFLFFRSVFFKKIGFFFAGGAKIFIFFVPEFGGQKRVPLFRAAI